MLPIFFISFGLFFFSSSTFYGFEREEPNDTLYLESIRKKSPDLSPEPKSHFEVPPPLPRSDEHAEYFSNYWDWKTACTISMRRNRSPLTKELFVREMDEFVSHFKTTGIMDPANWIKPTDGDAIMPSMRFLLSHSFEPFVTKLEVDFDEKTIFMGDIHGDIESFNIFLESLAIQGITDCGDPFKIIDPKSYVMFLGDYTDRGVWGIEVLYALSRFIRVNSPKGAVPRVFAQRGNHEDTNINATYAGHNLYKELCEKLNENNENKVIHAIKKFYNCLPLALILKSESHALLVNHGGIEPGFRDTRTVLNSTGKLKYILINKLFRKEMLEKLPPEFHPALADLERNGELKDFDPSVDNDNHLNKFWLFME